MIISPNITRASVPLAGPGPTTSASFPFGVFSRIVVVEPFPPCVCCQSRHYRPPSPLWKSAKAVLGPSAGTFQRHAARCPSSTFSLLSHSIHIDIFLPAGPALPNVRTQLQIPISCDSSSSSLAAGSTRSCQTILTAKTIGASAIRRCIRTSRFRNGTSGGFSPFSKSSQSLTSSSPAGSKRTSFYDPGIEEKSTIQCFLFRERDSE